jgi:hypothetical protein
MIDRRSGDTGGGTPATAGEVNEMLYTSQAYKVGDWWTVQCDQVPGAISQVAKLDEASQAQREAIAFVLNVPTGSFGVEVIVRPPVGAPG